METGCKVVQVLKRSGLALGVESRFKGNSGFEGIGIGTIG